MSELRYTLLSDGSSDVMLMPVLDWLLQRDSTRLFVGRWADLRILRRRPAGLRDRALVAVDLFPCNLDLLRKASGLTGRRLAKLRLGPLKHRVPAFIDDFAPLLSVPAFAALEEGLRSTLSAQRWT